MLRREVDTVGNNRTGPKTRFLTATTTRISVAANIGLKLIIAKG